jgi:chaperonin GroEL (HSP60 family)
VTAGSNPMEMKRGIETAVRTAVEGIDKLAKPVEGMQFDRGDLSPYFVTDPERMERSSRT